MDLGGESTVTVPDELASCKLPQRTRDVYLQLFSLATNGLLAETTADLARQLGMSRQALHKHMVRLRAADLLTELETCSTSDGGWRRLRRITVPGVYKPEHKNDSTHQATRTTVYKPRLQTRIYINTKDQFDMANPKGLRNETTDDDTRRSAALPRSAEADVNPLEVDVDTQLEELMQAGPQPRALNLEHLPPYPSAKRYATAHVPRMPRVSGDLNADAKLFIRAYKAICVDRYGKKPRVDRKATFRMRTAVTALRKAGFASPYAWAAFRLTQWTFSERSNKPPGIDYVFSRKVIEEHGEQYKRKAATYDVLNRVLLTPSHTRLLELWESCRRSALCPNSVEPGEKGTRAIVAKILPGSLYASLASSIAGERSAMEADLYRRLAAGEWIW